MLPRPFRLSGLPILLFLPELSGAAATLVLVGAAFIDPAPGEIVAEWIPDSSRGFRVAEALTFAENPDAS